MNGTIGWLESATKNVEEVWEQTPEQKDKEHNTEEKNVQDQHRLKKVAMFKNAQVA